LPFAIRYLLSPPFSDLPICRLPTCLPFSVVADSLMADTVVCPYHSLLAIRYLLPFRQSPVANHQSPPFSPVAAVLATRYSLFATRCHFPSWLIAIPTCWIAYQARPAHLPTCLPFYSLHRFSLAAFSLPCQNDFRLFTPD
jgi:hypothetical protein